MRRFVLTLCALVSIFATLSLVYDRAVLWFMRNSPSCVAAKIERAVQGGAGERIAIFGSSRALSNYKPSSFGVEAFNYGVNGMSLNEALRLVNVYLINNQSESIVLINLDPWGFLPDDPKELVGDYRLVSNRARTCELLHISHATAIDMMPGIRFQGMLREAMSTYLNTLKGISRVVDHGAELLPASRSRAEWEAINAKIVPHVFSCTKNNEQLLDLLYASQGRHKIVWVVSPISSNHHMLHRNPDAIKLFLTQQTSRPGVYSVDLFDRVSSYPDSYFADQTHLNLSGAEKFSCELCSELVMYRSL